MLFWNWTSGSDEKGFIFFFQYHCAFLQLSPLRKEHDHCIQTPWIPITEGWFCQIWLKRAQWIIKVTQTLIELISHSSLAPLTIILKKKCFQRGATLKSIDLKQINLLKTRFLPLNYPYLRFNHKEIDRLVINKEA